MGKIGVATRSFDELTDSPVIISPARFNTFTNCNSLHGNNRRKDKRIQ